MEHWNIGTSRPQIAAKICNPFEKVNVLQWQIAQWFTLHEFSTHIMYNVHTVYCNCKVKCAGKVLPPQIDTHSGWRQVGGSSKIDPGCGFHSHHRRPRWEPQINCQTNKLPISQINIKFTSQSGATTIPVVHNADMILSSCTESGTCFAITVHGV